MLLRNTLWVILLALLLACGKENKRLIVQDLTGSWRSCLDGEDYVEYHFTKYHTIGFIDGSIGLTYVYPYSTNQDTLIVYNDLVGGFLNNRFELKEDSLTIFRQNSTPIRLLRFSEYPVFQLEGCDLYGKQLDSIALKHYEYMFNKRKMAFSCKKEKSSPIQIPEDSIDMNLEDPPILEDL